MKMMGKFLVTLMLVSLVPVILTAFLSFRNSRDAIERAAIDHLVSVNQMKKMKIGTWVEDNIQTLEILAGNPFFINDFKQKPKKRSVADPVFGKDDKDICQSYFCPLLQTGKFSELFIMRIPDGFVQVSSDPLQEGKYHENRLYFIEGMKKTFVQNVYYSMTRQQTTMVISTPVRDRTGKTVAVIAGHVNLSPLSVIMEKTSGLNRTEDTYLVNSYNFFVTEPRFGKNYALRKSVYTQSVVEALSGRSGTGFYENYRGEHVIGVYSWIAERNLALITEMAREEVLEPVFSLQKTIFTLCLAVAGVVVFISWTVSRSLTRPLSDLVQCIQDIGQGNLDVHPDLMSKDEIGELAGAFRTMTERLKTTLVSKESLEQEIVTRKQAEKKLTAVMMELERSNKDLEQFAYVASHDLKEPLRMVWSYLDLIRERCENNLDEKGRSYMGFAVDGALRMDRMIGDLLEFARVSSQGKELQVVSAQAVFETALQNLQVAVRESEAEVACGQLPMVIGDETQLVLVFQNLIGNAIKFACKKPEISVSVETTGDICRFSVKDNGIGIDSRFSEDIFKIFQRLHTPSEYGGTGIGLALCRRIVERHGGRIWFESTPGEGAVFFFTLKKGDPDSLPEGDGDER